MNSMQLKDKLKQIAKNKSIDFNTLLRLYMYDRFIERLALSQYKDNFILKGGFYLSSLFGVESRTTMDIDTAFKNADFNEKTISKMIKEIISIDLNDNASIVFIGLTPIRDEDEYGGYRIDIQVEIENIKEKFHIDIATGDPITPKEIKYKYLPTLGESYIYLWAYNIETILAEKVETILSRAELNGRMRDYYDVYLIYTKDWSNINTNHLKRALKSTFTKREFNGNPNEIIDIIKTSDLIRNRWQIYQKKNKYCNNIELNEIIDIINIIITIYNEN